MGNFITKHMVEFWIGVAALIAALGYFLTHPDWKWPWKKPDQ